MKATAIGRMTAESASLWFLAIDAALVGAWKGDDGYDYEHDDVVRPSKKNRATDFGRAMDVKGAGGSIDVGRAKGIICRVGGCGASYIWRIDGGIALLCFYPRNDDPSSTALGKRVSDLPAFGKPQRLGKVVVESGCLSLLVPYQRAELSPAMIRGAVKSKKAKPVVDGGVLVPLPNGTYDIFSERLGGRKDPEDELGSYERRVRIVEA